MKRFIYFAIIALFAMTGCQKEATLSDLLCGEWRGSELSVDAGIYIDFNADGSFEMFQKMGGEGFELKNGSWSMAGTTLSGKYKDGETWSSAYTISISGDVLTMTSQAEGGEVNKYVKTTIPAAVREAAYAY
jgi:hypothetical protein